MNAYRIVAVGTDGSDSSLRAVERAGRVAAQTNAKLIFATVYLPGHYPHGEATRAVDLLKDQGYKTSGNGCDPAARRWG
jgi:nucleotide-binding universal stress UspA family protein